MSLQIFTFRLQPGEDLKKSLVQKAHEKQLRAASVLCGIGSLNNLCLRLSSQSEPLQITESFEILTLQGTLSIQGVHLHMSVADSKGHVYGGHLLDGCQIFTTAEITLVEQNEIEFMREKDNRTGYLELVIRPRASDTK